MLGVELKVPGGRALVTSVQVQKSHHAPLFDLEIMVKASVIHSEVRPRYRRVGEPRSAEDIND